MQPFPNFSPFNSPAAYLVLASLMWAGGSQAILQNKAAVTAIQSAVTLVSNEDDRGSGRLSNQTEFPDPVGLRGSGRIRPGSDRSGEATQVDPPLYYRGSGRLS